MLKRRMVDILLSAVLLAILLGLLLLCQPNLVHCEDATEQDTYDMDVTEMESIVVGVTSTEESPTEMPPESIETATEEVLENSEENIEEETKEPPEATYYCEWGDFYLTQEEYELLLTTVYCESQTGTREMQYMVALVILNQYNSGKFGDTLREVIYRKNNFSVTKWDGFEDYGWSEKVEESVAKAMKVNKHPKDMYYFRTGHYHNWEYAEDYKRVGKVYFSTHK